MAPTTDPPAKLGAIAHAIRQALAPVAADVYAYEPIGADHDLPAIYVADVTLERSELGALEDQLGADDWLSTWTIVAHVPLEDPESSTAAARALVGQVVAALDADWRLGEEAIESRAISAELGPNTQNPQRPLIVAEMQCVVLSLMPRP